jgi:hypothetical protein
VDALPSCRSHWLLALIFPEPLGALHVHQDHYRPPTLERPDATDSPAHWSTTPIAFARPSPSLLATGAESLGNLHVDHGSLAPPPFLMLTKQAPVIPGCLHMHPSLPGLEVGQRQRLF